VLVRQFGTFILDGGSITPDLLGACDAAVTLAPATPALSLLVSRQRTPRRVLKRKPNPSLGEIFAMVTGGGTLLVMASVVIKLPTLRLPATGLRSNQAF
jgi:hypothetical protein